MKRDCVHVDMARLRQAMRARGYVDDKTLYPATIGRATYYSILRGQPVRASTARTIALTFGVTLSEITAGVERRHSALTPLAARCLRAHA